MHNCAWLAACIRGRIDASYLSSGSFSSKASSKLGPSSRSGCRPYGAGSWSGDGPYRAADLMHGVMSGLWAKGMALGTMAHLVALHAWHGAEHGACRSVPISLPVVTGRLCFWGILGAGGSGCTGVWTPPGVLSCVSHTPASGCCSTQAALLCLGSLPKRHCCRSSHCSAFAAGLTVRPDGLRITAQPVGGKHAC